MNRSCVLLMLALALPVAAQNDKARDERPTKPAAKGPVRRSAQRPAHAKPTPEQIRRFNRLEKEEERGKPGESGDAAKSPK